MRKLSLVILGILAVVFTSVRLMSDSPHGKDFKLSCDLCHSSKGWKLDKEIYAFDHNKTVFPLQGQHQSVDCRLCHPTLVFAEAKTACAECHTDIHYQTVGPDCGRCHTPRSWIVENITELHQRSRFPLLGAHNTTDCSVCHKSASLLRFEPLGTTCYDCHRTDFEGTTKPNHVQSNYSTDCSECHKVNSFSWYSTNVDHSFFPLTLGHAIDCNQCHKSNDFTNLSSACSSCHLPNYNATTNPNHTAASIPTTCADCHTTNPGWKPATFAIHNTYWPLTGAHATSVTCDQCHNGVYTNTPNTCVGCHLTNYNQTTNPPHAAAQFGTDCQTCHTTTAWQPATFDHDNKYFPIYSGKHQGTWTLCTDCHTNASNYGEFSCIDCHAHNKPDMDSHHSGVGGYAYNSLACYTCHPTGSTGGSFNHNTSGFPLTGAHRSILCSSCHTNGFIGTPTDCSACHTPAYNQTANPSHSTIGIPTTCASCHTTNPGWKPATFPLHNNYYTLTGGHALVANNCDQCHKGNYTSTTTACVGCHMTNYNGTNNPYHSTIGISTDCQTCHTTTPGWSPALMPTHNNYWPLTGAHATVPTCDQCHNGNYNSAPTTCVGCHLNDYNQTNNPPHASAQFPTTCDMCHTTTAWIPSTFNHDQQYFPIYSGHHAGTWTLCSDCHTNPNNYAVFTCITCHQQTEMDNAHQGVPGYTYNSQACYNCHPNGAAPQNKMKPRTIRKTN